MCVDLLVGTRARAVEAEPAEPEEESTCGHCHSVIFLDSRRTLCLFATTPNSRLTNLVTC